MRIKVLSWNIWIDGNFEEVKLFLKESNADIVGLQEVEADEPSRDLISYMRELGYDSVFAPVPKKAKLPGHRDVNDGPALFSRYPIRRSQSHMLSEEDARAAVSAELEIEGRVLHAFSTHLLHTHQQESALQRKQVDNLLQLLPNKETIVMGDFNATPESTVIQNLRSILADSDPIGAPTWNINPVGADSVCDPLQLHIRIDYIFATPDLRMSGAKVEFSKASDHLPISVIVEI